MGLNNLFGNSLFNGCNTDLIKKVLSRDEPIVKHYKKDSIIVQEYQKCKHISFITKGSLYVNEISKEGNIFRIKLYKKNDSFGCSLYGAKNKDYPFTLIANEDSQIIHIPFEQIRLMLTHDSIFMDNFIEMLSNNILSLKDRIKILSFKNVRDKLMFYLYKNSENGVTKINHTKTEISKILGIARGSISRELKIMEEENIISFINKNTLRILI